MANPWRKALSSFLSIVLVAGLLPCVSFYGSAWASDAEGEGSAVEAAQVEEGASTADSDLAAALKQDGALWTWGCNNYGQLGYW